MNACVYSVPVQHLLLANMVIEKIVGECKIAGCSGSKIFEHGRGKNGGGSIRVSSNG